MRKKNKKLFLYLSISFVVIAFLSIFIYFGLFQQSVFGDYEINTFKWKSYNWRLGGGSIDAKNGFLTGEYGSYKVDDVLNIHSNPGAEQIASGVILGTTNAKLNLKDINKIEISYAAEHNGQDIRLHKGFNEKYSCLYIYLSLGSPSLVDILNINNQISLTKDGICVEVDSELNYLTDEVFYSNNLILEKTRIGLGDVPDEWKISSYLGEYSVTIPKDKVSELLFVINSGRGTTNYIDLNIKDIKITYLDDITPPLIEPLIEPLVYKNPSQDCNEVGCDTSYKCQIITGLCITEQKIDISCVNLGCPSNFKCNTETKECEKSLGAPDTSVTKEEKSLINIPLLIGGIIILILFVIVIVLLIRRFKR